MTAAQDHVVCGPDCQCGCEAGRTIPVRSAATALFPLPDMTAIPVIGSAQRDADERFANARARELVIEQGGRLREALYELEQEIRGPSRTTTQVVNATRAYARELVDHVEQCWASAVIR